MTEDPSRPVPSNESFGLVLDELALLRQQVQAIGDELEKSRRQATKRDKRLSTRVRLLEETPGRKPRLLSRALAGAKRRPADQVDEGVAEGLRRSIDSGFADVSRSLAKAERRQNAALRRQTRQLEAVTVLTSLVELTAPLPPLGGWALSPDALLWLTDRFFDSRPRLIVECGSGASTLWFALLAAKYAPETVVVSLEHDSTFLEQTRRRLETHGVDQFVQLRHAPLEQQAGDFPSPWYASSAWSDLDGIDLLVIDGPPTTTGESARLPAGQLFPKLSKGAVVFVDDANREADGLVIEAWAQQFPEIEGQKVNLEKGGWTFTR